MDSDASPATTSTKKTVTIYTTSDVKSASANKITVQSAADSHLAQSNKGKTKITVKGGSSNLIAKIKSSLEKALNSPMRISTSGVPDIDPKTFASDDDAAARSVSKEVKSAGNNKFIKIVQNEVVIKRPPTANVDVEPEDDKLAASSEEEDVDQPNGSKSEDNEAVDKKALTKIKLKQAKQARFELDKCKPELKFKIPPKRVYKRKRSNDMDESPSGSQDEDDGDAKTANLDDSKDTIIKIEIHEGDEELEEEEEEEEKPKKVYKKRGRKSKAELEEIAKQKALEAEMKPEDEGAADDDDDDDYDVDEDDDDDDDDDEIFQISIMPTKRGRVPKPRVFQNYVTPNKKVKAESEAGGEEVERPPPKKRGRPPKPKDVPVVVQDDDEEDAEDASTPRRRGKPRILRTATPTTKESKLKSDEVQADDAAANPAPVKRRPGRPCKQPAVTSSPKSKVKACGARSWRQIESPSTSGQDGGVDEPSQRETNSIDNENVADEGVVVQEDEEDAYTKQYRLLVSNLVKGIRLEMEQAKIQPQSSNDSSTVTCAICQAHFHRNAWNLHKRLQHNNLAWLTTESPLNLDKVAVVISILNALYPSKPFKCNFCGTSKKSVLGFLTHKTTCNKTDAELQELLVPCSGCPKMIFPYQLVDHEKRHRLSIKNTISAQVLVSGVDYDVPSKRSAAKRASMLIQSVAGDLDDNDSDFSTKNILKHFHKDLRTAENMLQSAFDEKGTMQCLFPSCECTFNNFEEFANHFTICPLYIETYFICKFCPFLGIGFTELLAHLTQRHGEVLTNDATFDESDAMLETMDDEYMYLREFADEDYPEPIFETKSLVPAIDANLFWKMHKFSQLKHCSHTLRKYPFGINLLHYSRMLDFCEQHHSSNLFANYPFKQENWMSLHKFEIAEYLPSLKLSMLVGEESATKYMDYKSPLSARKTSCEFKRYKLFETSLNKDVVTIFCGGPITALAWAPTPFDFDGAEQMLAVAVQQHPDMIYNINDAQYNKSVIQLWNFGILANDVSIVSGPRLELCIAHDCGGIFAMEWCPSGCYQRPGTRLGLLAHTSTDSNVYCYSIAHSKVLREKICKPKPIFKLSLSNEYDNFDSSCYPTCLSWTKAKEHKSIAVGYTNGCFAMFNLQNTNPLLESVDADDVCVRFPYLIIKAHRLLVSAISLNHRGGGDRYVVTSSFDRSLKFWDLKVSTCRHIYGVKRATANQIFWPVNAITVFQASEGSSSNLYLTMVNHHLTNFNYTRCNSILHSTSPSRAISGHDWGLVTYHGNDIGEIMCASVQNLYPFALDINCKRYLISCATLMPRNKRSDEPALDYITADNRYRLKFSNYSLGRHQDMVTMDKGKKSVFEGDAKTIPLQAVTALCTNNNRFSFLFTAAGYNAGFVRVYHSKFHNYQSF